MLNLCNQSRDIVSGGRLYCRKSPSKSAAYWGQFADGAKIQVKEISGNTDWYETYWNNDTRKVGYVMKTYVEAATHPDISVQYNPDVAVRYALNHSTGGGKSGADPKRNTVFGNATTNDCANFVSQCLCAGGLPMFNGWSYPLTNIPAGWNSNSKWKLTYGSCQKLLGKDRIYEIGDPTKTQRGDIIYTFDSSQAEGKQYTHVTIATSNYSSAIGGCYICGHSVNQNGDYGDTKKLVAGKVKIYRVRTSVIVGGTERRVSIPVSGNEATVINDTF